MGEVYRARDSRLERDVAIKVLPDHLADDPTALARFEREAKAVAALSHPNILAIHDFGSHERTAFAVIRPATPQAWGRSSAFRRCSRERFANGATNCSSAANWSTCEPTASSPGGAVPP